MIECVVFDLDGTLVRSHETIFKATVETLKNLGLKSDFDKNRFYNLLGHHFKDIFEECGVYVPDTELFIDHYKKCYFNYINSSRLYSSTEDVLRELKKRNIFTGLLTTKGHDQAEKIVAHFNLDPLLDSVEGRKNGVPIKPAPDQFFKICRDVNADPRKSLMVGDTELDIKCGKSAGAETCAVTFGYREIEDLKSNNPDYIIDDLIKVLDIVQQTK